MTGDAFRREIFRLCFAFSLAFSAARSDVSAESRPAVLRAFNFLRDCRAYRALLTHVLPVVRVDDVVGAYGDEMKLGAELVARDSR